MVMVNTQRPAIEGVIDFKEESIPESIWRKRIVSDVGAPLYILGVSDGLGAYANLKGVDILVLGFNSPGDRVIRKTLCRYAVLLREPTTEERVRENLYRGDNVMLACVQGLRCQQETNDSIVFEMTDRKEIYVKIL